MASPNQNSKQGGVRTGIVLEVRAVREEVKEVDSSLGIETVSMNVEE